MTGGAGFIGRYLIDILLNKKFKVTIFDNFSNCSEDLIVDLLDRGVILKKGNITNFEQISNAIIGHDIVVHLAAKISVEESIKDPETTYKINIEGTENILKAMSKSGIKKLIVASSAAIYEDLKDSQSFHNEESGIHPISPYGKSKLLMEKKIEEYILKNKINCIILRFFNIYGIGQTPEYAGVISKFVTQIKKEKPLNIFGDGLQSRDFVCIHDVVLSINQSIEKIDYKKFEIYNIASGESITINSLAKILLKLFDKKLEIFHDSPRKGDIRNSKASIKKAQSELDYHPKISLEEGLKQFIGE